jgi:hypothetical protein
MHAKLYSLYLKFAVHNLKIRFLMNIVESRLSEPKGTDRCSDYRKCRIVRNFFEKNCLGNFLNPSMHSSCSTKLVEQEELGF